MTTENTNLKPGDVTPEGMIVVGPFKGKLLLREPFSTAIRFEFWKRSEANRDEHRASISGWLQGIDNVPPDPAKRTHLPSAEEAELIASTLSKEEKKTLKYFWLDGRGEFNQDLIDVRHERPNFTWATPTWAPAKYIGNDYYPAHEVERSLPGCLVCSVDL